MNIQALQSGAYKVPQNTKLAATLAALGFRPIEGGECTNTYSAEKPDRRGQPGHVIFFLGRKSETYTGDDGQPLGAETLTAAFHTGEGDALLDELIEQVDEPLRAKIKAALPLAHASHIRAGLENYLKMRTWWRKAAKYILMKRGKKTFLVGANDRELAKEWKLTK